MNKACCRECHRVLMAFVATGEIQEISSRKSGSSMVELGHSSDSCWALLSDLR